MQNYFRVKRVDRRDRFTLISEFPVGGILDNQKAVLSGKADKNLPLAKAEGFPGRILEIGYCIEELDFLSGILTFEDGIFPASAKLLKVRNCLDPDHFGSVGAE